MRPRGEVWGPASPRLGLLTLGVVLCLSPAAAAQTPPPAEGADTAGEPSPPDDNASTEESTAEQAADVQPEEAAEEPAEAAPRPEEPATDVTLSQRMGNVDVRTFKLELASLSPGQMRRSTQDLQRKLRQKFRTVPFEGDVSGIKFQYAPGKGVNGGGLGTLSLTLQAYDLQGQPMSSAHLYEFSRASNGSEINEFVSGKSGYSFDLVGRYVVLRGLVEDADAEVSRLIDFMVFDERGYGHVSLPEIPGPPAPPPEDEPVPSDESEALPPQDPPEPAPPATP